MDDNDRRVINAMFMYGGSFVQNLARLAQFADECNLSRIKNTWQDYWERYTHLADEHERRDREASGDDNS